MKLHFAVHTGIKEFACENCNKGFASHSKVKRHMKLHCKALKKAATEESDLLQEGWSQISFNLTFPFHEPILSICWNKNKPVYCNKTVLTTQSPFHLIKTFWKSAILRIVMPSKIENIVKILHKHNKEGGKIKKVSKFLPMNLFTRISLQVEKRKFISSAQVLPRLNELYLQLSWKQQH